MLKTGILISWLVMHPVHVTLMSMDYITKEKTIKAYLKVYYDDFLLDYKLMNGNVDEFDVDNSPGEARKNIEWYLEGRVKVIAGDKIFKGIVDDFSLSDNELKMNLTFIIRGKPESVTVENSMLTGVYEDQSNLLIFRVGDSEEGVKLTPEKSSKDFSIK